MIIIVANPFWFILLFLTAVFRAMGKQIMLSRVEYWRLTIMTTLLNGIMMDINA